MSQTKVHAFESTIQTTNTWLHELQERLGLPDRQAAYHVLRVVLQALRDRLNVEQAAALGSQLPMLVRGFFFESWQPKDKPIRIRKKEEFLEHLAKELPRGSADPEAVVRAVFDVLGRHVSQGEMKHIQLSLPHELRSLFADQFHTLWF
jgi:uncharacterized protein (DUF2267 family)